MIAEEPNFYAVHGRDLQITYSTTSLTGQPQMTYHDATQARQFGSDEMTVEATTVGQLVSVVLTNTPDLGSTTFSLLLPGVNLSGRGAQPISTIGITSVHRTTIAGPPPGQTTTVRVTRLRGTTDNVNF